MEKVREMVMKIDPTPFSNQGLSMWPFWATITESTQEIRLADFVCKRFKPPINTTETHKMHSRSNYLERVEAYALTTCLADEFNRAADGVLFGKGAPARNGSRFETGEPVVITKIGFTEVGLLEMTVPTEAESVFYNIEEESTQQFDRYHNSAGYFQNRVYHDTVEVRGISTVRIYIRCIVCLICRYQKTPVLLVINPAVNCSDHHIM